jgi:hypothetical protein
MPYSFAESLSGNHPGSTRSNYTLLTRKPFVKW